MKKINVLIAKDMLLLLTMRARYATKFTDGQANVDLANNGEIAGYMVKGKMHAMITCPDSGHYLDEVMSALDLCSNAKSTIPFAASEKDPPHCVTIQINPYLKR